MVLNIRGKLRMEWSDMVTEYKCGLMEANMKDTGKMEFKVEEANSFISTVTFMTVRYELLIFV